MIMESKLVRVRECHSKLSFMAQGHSLHLSSELLMHIIGTNRWQLQEVYIQHSIIYVHLSLCVTIWRHVEVASPVP